MIQNQQDVFTVQFTKSEDKERVKNKFRQLCEWWNSLLEAIWEKGQGKGDIFSFVLVEIQTYHYQYFKYVQ